MRIKRLITALGVLASLAMLGAFGPAVAVADTKCDRQCLVTLMDKYFAALVKHDPSAVPLANNVKFVENTAIIPIGDGLWVTSTGVPADFKIYAADPILGQVASIVMMQENNKDIILGARLKYQDGKITEVEHLVIRNVGKNSLPNLQKPRPGLVQDLDPSERTPRDQMLKIGNS